MSAVITSILNDSHLLLHLGGKFKIDEEVLRQRFGRGSINKESLRSLKAFENTETRHFHQVFRLGEMIIFPSLSTIRHLTPSSF